MNVKTIAIVTLKVLGIFVLLRWIMMIAFSGVLCFIIHNDDDCVNVSGILSAIVILICYYKMNKQKTSVMVDNIRSPDLNVKNIAAVVIMGIASYLFWILLASGFLNMLDSGLHFKKNMLDGHITLIVIEMCVVAPIIEEIAFRGILLSKIREIKGFRFSSIYTSIVFSVIHFDVWLLPCHFSAGVLLSFVWEKKQNIIMCIIMHSAVNSTFILVRMIEKQVEKLLNYHYLFDFGLTLFSLAVVIIGLVLINQSQPREEMCNGKV